MPTTLLRYRWRYFDSVREKNVATRYHATRAEVEREHPDAVPVPGSEQLLALVDDPLVNSMARFQVGAVVRE
jgi:hypothetical protein